jgi:hypothetical protein
MSDCPTCHRRFATPSALAHHQRNTHANPHWKAAKSAKRPQAPVCPACGNTAALSAGKYGIKASCCGLWSWGYKPLVDRDTHIARINAHAAFDALWKGGALSRGECYRRLQIAMGMNEAECHIAQMSAAAARRVVEIVRAGSLLVVREVAHV